MGTSRMKRAEKVQQIFNQFDLNADGGLNRDEMSSLVISVNPMVNFSQEQIDAILDEVFKTYHDYIDVKRGLSLEGLARTYDDGAGDVDRDFHALRLEPNDLFATSSSSIAEVVFDEEEHGKDLRTAAWAETPNQGIVFDETVKMVDDLEILIRRLKSKQCKSGKLKGEQCDAYSEEPGWSNTTTTPEFGQVSEVFEKKVFWDELGHGYIAFIKELEVLRGRADGVGAKSGLERVEEVFDAHMAIGRLLYDNHLFKEALVSFSRACELQPTNFRPHFRAGNCLYVLGRFREGKEEFLLALKAAESGGNQWSYLLPQIHVNLGISLEAEGMILSACEHYREAAILCPTHFRALKLLGSALFGVGEYQAAEKALEEAIFLKSDYPDAHCDLGSALHAMGEDDRAVREFQKAIDLRAGHVDALYNLGGLYMDMGRYQRASEMYTRVLAVWPSHWRAQLNKAVALLGINDGEEARKTLKEAFKMTNRVELHDAIAHFKQLDKKRSKQNGGGGNDDEEGFLVVELSKFKTIGSETTKREELANALNIRDFQKLTRLNHCNVDILKKEMNEYKVPEKSVRKPALEGILCRLLHFLKPETFQGAVRAINRRILSIFDDWGSGDINLGMFYAVISPICKGSSVKRKRMVFDALMWLRGNIDEARIRKSVAVRYIELLRAIYISSYEFNENQGEVDDTTLSFPEFLDMFDDLNSGFGIMSTLMKLESGDRTRHGNHACSACRYPITGSRFKEMKSHFSLCSQCYSEGKVPSEFKQEEYTFKEYGSQTEAIKDKCNFLSLHSKSLPRDFS
ncbi:hypothetical protein GIB67_019483 [Kingdonia uniflora]|uniref:EF-hand domain-containing protein n=1 Tax=Kingdonia uniflora TaxID=39325 RepID=A0A7J7N082_9MAGN|nr:hypothetical protein GIB67_019483 [Kingdonia uniflora]